MKLNIFFFAAMVFLATLSVDAEPIRGIKKPNHFNELVILS